MGDVELLEQVAEGDRAALASLYDRHAPWLVLRLQGRCADAGLVDETVQDTFVGVWRGAGRYRGEGDVGAWIWGIAIRRLIDRLRRHAPVTVAFDERHGGTVRSAEEQVLVGVEYGDLGAAIDRLAPELRSVVQATVLDGLTTREASRLLGIPAGTVKTRMRRARLQMREALA